MVYTLNQNWRNGEQLTAEKFNTRIEDNLQWLRNRNINSLIIRNGVTDITQTVAGTWFPISASVLYNTIETRGGDILITFTAGFANAAVNARFYGDFFIKPANYAGFFASSLTATPLATGCFGHQTGSGFVIRKTYRFLLTNPPANSYRITPYWQSSSGTVTMNVTNTIVELTSEEYGEFSVFVPN